MITLYWHDQPSPISSCQSHDWQRRLLARYLGAHDVTIDRSHGKPVVCPPYTISFSVSHSAFNGQYAWVMAVHPHNDVGVDMEPLARSIQPAVFSRGTHGNPPPLYHPRHRVLAWTQFEALAKCRGTGIRFPIPRRFPNRFGSFLWKGWVVTLACSAAMPSIHVVPVDGQSECLSNSVQHSDQQLDNILSRSNSFVLIWEQMPKMSIVSVEGDSNACDPVILKM